MRIFPPNVEKMRTKGDVKGLIDVLDWEKKSVFIIQAAQALGDLREEQAVPALNLLLHRDDPEVRQAALDSLGKIRGERADKALLEAVMGKNQQAAAIVIGKIGDQALILPLLELFKATDENMRLQAAHALGQIGLPVVGDLIERLADGKWQVRDAAMAALEKIGASAEPELIKALQSNNDHTRFCAARCLGNLGSTAASEALRALMKDNADLVRMNAIKALRKIGGEGLEDILIGALQDSSEAVRKEGIEGLSVLGGERGTRALVSSLYDEEDNLREKAANALKKLGWQPDKGRDGAGYYAALSMWNECVGCKKKAVEALLLALKAKDNYTREGAATALGKIGDARAVQPLINTLQVHQDSIYIESLATLGSPEAVKAIIAALRSGNRWVVEKAAWVLKKFDDATAIPALITLLHDANYGIRATAAETLVHYYHSQKIEASWKPQILAQRETILKHHTDIDDKCTDHTDTDGIGVSFPL